jgi:O-antigen/teichoic acid export membrane protein
MKLSGHITALALAAIITAAIIFGVASLARPVLTWWHGLGPIVQAWLIALCLLASFGATGYRLWRRRQARAADQSPER